VNVSENPQTGESQDGNELDQVRRYRELVLEYEALDEAVDSLLVQHKGSTDQMSEDDLIRYRELARRRDDVYNQMKTIEHQILLDDDNA
jgi:hypothetical protein